MRVKSMKMGGAESFEHHPRGLKPDLYYGSVP